MGTTMMAIAEVRCADSWALVDQPVFPYPSDGKLDASPFAWKGYGMYGLFAGIRNRSQSAVLTKARGVPEDISKAAAEKIIGGYPFEDFGTWGAPLNLSLVEQVEEAAGSREEYGFTWLTAKELLTFDYDASFLDLAEAPPREKTYREFLGADYFTHLDVLRVLGHPEGVRVIVWFNE